MVFIVVHELDFFKTQIGEVEREKLQLFVTEFDKFWESNVVPGDVATSILKYKPTKIKERLVVLRDVDSTGPIIGMFLLSYEEENFFVERFAVTETENIEQFVRNFVSCNRHPVLRINKKELLAYTNEKEELGLQGFNTKPEKEGEYFIITLINSDIISGLCYVAKLFPPPITPSNVVEQIPEEMAIENPTQEHDTSRASQITNINLSPRAAEPKNTSSFATTSSGVKSLSGRKLCVSSSSSIAYKNDDEIAQPKNIDKTTPNAHENELTPDVLNTVLYAASVSGHLLSATSDAFENSSIVDKEGNNIAARNDKDIIGTNYNNVIVELNGEKNRGPGRPPGSKNKNTRAKRPRK